MIASFKFESYKVDYLVFDIKRILGLLELNETINPKDWRYSLAFREPLFSASGKKYIGGIDIGVYLLPIEGRGDNHFIKKEDIKDFLIKLELGTAGVFSVEEGRFSKEIEEKLVKLQIPALLLPYARATITALLANAGFGSIVLPLINLHEAAKETIGNIEIKVID